MSALRNIALAVLSISFVTFVAFFGRLPAFRNTPIGFLHRIIWIHIPNVFSSLDKAITGGKSARKLVQLGDYLFYRKHPLVVVFFLGLVTASTLLFVPTAWPFLPTHHKFLIPLIVPWPYIFTWLSARAGPTAPQTITRENLTEQLSQYPYDLTLYHPGVICSTCDMPKPARSKHCSLCNACIARSDHHCVWVNNCLGRGNYKYFLWLLFMTSALLTYGAFLSYIVLAPMVTSYLEQWPAPLYPVDAAFFHKYVIAKLEHVADILAAAVNTGGISLAAVGLLAALTSPLPAALLMYHIYLIWAGTTTNESAKWADLRDDMHYGYVHTAKLKERLPPGYLPQSDWSLKPRQFVLRSTGDSLTKETQDQYQQVVEEDSWKQCWRLADVENIYDLGFWDNFVDVMTD